MVVLPHGKGPFTMATDHVPATLSFLTDAAHLLALSSPETSAHLMSQRNSLMFNTDLDQPDVQRQHVCGCCGHIMIFGRGDTFEIERSKRVHKRKASRTTDKANVVPPKAGCRKTLTCNKCGRYTKINLPAPGRIPKRRFGHPARPPARPPTVLTGVADTASQLRSANTSAVTSTSAPIKASANANSKKRAKNRKQGLQALLQQSFNSKSQAGLGLSLADFMQN